MIGFHCSASKRSWYFAERQRTDIIHIRHTGQFQVVSVIGHIFDCAPVACVNVELLRKPCPHRLDYIAGMVFAGLLQKMLPAGPKLFLKVHKKGNRLFT